MSGHNEAPSEFEIVLPETIRSILDEVAAYGGSRSAGAGREASMPAPGRPPQGGADRPLPGDAAGVRAAERSFITTMEGLYGYLGRELDALGRPLAGLSDAELDDLAQRLAGSLKGG